MAYDVLVGGHLGGARIFSVSPAGIPDGITVDRRGRVYVSAAAGVLVYGPDGDLLGEIPVPGAVNFAFGGRSRNVLLITADTAVWAAVLPATGPHPADPHTTRGERFA
jgi:gluconolactonase